MDEIKRAELIKNPDPKMLNKLGQGTGY